MSSIAKAVCRVALVLIVCGSVVLFAAETETILVTAPRPNRNPLEEPTVESPALDIATSYVDTGDIRRQNTRTVVDAVNYAPGVVTETRGRKVKQFSSFRGQMYPYPSYALNGVWLNEFEELPYLMSAAQFERIEMIRSSASLLIGLSGQTGVINLVPRRSTVEETYLAAQYGSYNTVRSHISHTQPSGSGRYTVSAGYFSTDGKEDTNARERTGNVGVYADWAQTEKLKIELNALYLYGTRELRQAEDPASRALQITDEEFDPYAATIVSVRGLHRQSDSSATEVTLHLSDRVADFKSTTEGVHASNSERDYEYGLSAIQALALTDDNIMRVGALYNRWIAPNGKRYSTRRTDMHTVSGVVVDEHQFRDLHVDGGFRYAQHYYEEYSHFSINGSSKGFETVDPVVNEWSGPVMRGNLGLSYEMVDGVSLLCNLSSGVIEPRTGTLDTELTRPRNEDRNTMDAGVKYEDDRFGIVSLGAFLSIRDNALLLSGETMENERGEELELYENQDLRQYGMEFEAKSAELMDAVRVFLNVVVMESEAMTDGSYEPYTDLPDTIVSAGLYGRLGRVDANLFGKYVSEFESKRFAADSQLHPLGDYTDLNLSAGYSMGDKKTTRLYCLIENLTNEKYSTVVGYPDYGIRLHAGVQHIF